MSRTRDYSTLLVVDLEATCWRGPPPDGMISEIIEIGLTPLDLRALAVGEKQSILVRPEVSTVSNFCTELTTLTQEQVDGGVTFRDACRQLVESHRSGGRVWASYGEYDRRTFRSQCDRTGVAYPFGDHHIDVKTLVALSRGRSPVGLRAACELAGRDLEGTHHRGDDDALNVAHLLARLLGEARAAFMPEVLS